MFRVIIFLMVSIEKGRRSACRCVFCDCCCGARVVHGPCPGAGAAWLTKIAPAAGRPWGLSEAVWDFLVLAPVAEYQDQRHAEPVEAWTFSTTIHPSTSSG